MSDVEILNLPDSGLLRIGVVADTHVPDRVVGLHPALLSTLQQEKVDYIFHAGDICDEQIETQLSKVAPVRAVLGNRDWLYGRKLPHVYRFEVNGTRGVLMHGQGTFLDYWWDKVWYTLEGYRFARYRKTLEKMAPDCDLFIFGHTHRAENMVEDGRWFFNPGCASSPKYRRGPSIGVLQFELGKAPQGKIITLDGAFLEGRNWKTNK